MKRLLCVLLMISISAGFLTAYAAPRTTSEKEALYAASIENLEAYLEAGDSHDAPDLLGIEESFRQLGRYEQSQWLMYYTQVLICLETDTYDYETSMILEIMDTNDDFKAYLSGQLKSSSIGSVEKLRLYAKGRQAEYENQIIKAVDCYKECLSFFDAQERYRKLRTAQDEEMYQRAANFLKAGNFAAAYYTYDLTNNYRDSEVYKEAIVSMLSYTPIDQYDNPIAVEKLETSVKATGVEASWESPKHANSYRITIQKKGNNDTHIVEQKANRIYYDDLEPGTTYVIKVEAVCGSIETEPCIAEITTSVSTPIPLPTHQPTDVPLPTPTYRPTSLRPGDIVLFGRYEQDDNENNGTEPIEWQVLDVQNNQVLLLSRFGLDSKKYDESRLTMDRRSWSNSTLRTWLNETFINMAFTHEEQKAIVQKNIKVRDYWEPLKAITQDHVFLLDQDDFWTYFDDYTQLICKPTKKVLSLIRENTHINLIQVIAYSWMDRNGMQINDDGRISGAYNVDYNVIRPAMWLNTNVAEPYVKERKLESQNPTTSAKVKKGAIVTFGSYEQDAEMQNGKETIEWIVLDVQGSKALLISRKGLECRPFDETDKEIAWEDSALRNWLNNIFIQEAFSPTELESIATTNVDNSKKQGNFVSHSTTKDRLFLLSKNEAKSYSSTLDSVCKTTPVAKKKQGYGFDCEWWLRTASSQQYPNMIDVIGGSWGSAADHVAVRPAMWVKLKSVMLP